MPRNGRSASAFLEAYIVTNPCDQIETSRQGNKTLSKTAVVPGNVHNGIPLSATATGGSLLEELRAAYRSLNPEERQEIKAFMSDLAEEKRRSTVQEREL